MCAANKQENIKVVGNPLPVINKYYGLVSKLFNELEGVPWDWESPSARKKEISNEILDQLHVYLSKRSDERVNPIADAEDVLETINKIDDMPSAVVEHNIDEYRSELISILSRCISLYFEIEDEILRFFNHFYKDVVLSNRARWGIILHGNRSVLLEVLKDLMSHMGKEWSEKPLENHGSHKLQMLVQMTRRALAIPEQEADILDKYDYLDFFSRGLLTSSARTEIDPSLPSSTASDILLAISGFRHVIHSISPRIVARDCSKSQTQQIRIIHEIDNDFERARKRNLIQRSIDGVNVSDFDSLIADHPLSGDVKLGSINDILSMKFYSSDDQNSIKQDLDEIQSAFKAKAYKLTTIGCGAFMEHLLKEYLYRNSEQLQKLKKNESFWNMTFSKSPNYVDESSVKTWGLFALVKVSGRLFQDKESELERRCELLRKSRNKVHGGSLTEKHALMAIETLRLIYNEIQLTQ